MPDSTYRHDGLSPVEEILHNRPDSSLSSYLHAVDQDVLRSSKQVSVLNEQGPLPIIHEEMINTDSIAVPPGAPEQDPIVNPP